MRKIWCERCSKEYEETFIELEDYDGNVYFVCAECAKDEGI